jgi:hypothetical protein
MNQKGLEGNGRGLIELMSRTLPGGTEENYEDDHDNRIPCRNSKQSSPGILVGSGKATQFIFHSIQGVSEVMVKNLRMKLHTSISKNVSVNMDPQIIMRNIAHFMLRSATDQGSTSAETKNETYILLRMVLLNISYFSFTAFNKQDVTC